MTPEVLVGVIALLFTLIGLVGKSISDTKDEIQKATTIQVKTEGQLEMIVYRLNNLEKMMTSLETTLDVLTRDISTNGDWQHRKNQ